MTDKEEREACEKYLLRAGFKHGWENLESVARFFVRFAVQEEEKSSQEEALSDMISRWESAGAKPSGDDYYLQGFRDSMLSAASELRSLTAFGAAVAAREQEALSLEKKWCHYCKEDTHNDAECWCTRCVDNRPICSADGCSSRKPCGPYCRDRGNFK